MPNLILLVIIAYLIGSVPTSILVVKAVKRVDVRDYGSGNAGGTNVSRVAGWGWGVFVILVDALKGFLAATLLPQLLPIDMFMFDPGLSGILAGVVAMLGHVFPLFANFRGGKGVATAAGIAIAVTEPYWAILIALAVFAVVVAAGRYMFLASIAAGVTYGVLVWFFAPESAVSLRVFATACVLLLILLHRANIGRFRRGVENRLGQKTVVLPEESSGEEQS